MQTALTALALDPELRIVSLVSAEFDLPLDEDFLDSRLAVLTHDVVHAGDDALAAKTGLLDDGVAAELLALGDLRNVNVARVLADEQVTLRILQNWLEQANKRLLQLVV